LVAGINERLLLDGCEAVAIAPRLQILYRWSADILGQPRLLELIEYGNPTYVWSATDRGVWAQPTRRSALAGPLAKITAPRRSFA
jgi:hypothetical protein